MMSELSPVAVPSHPIPGDEQQPDSVLDSHLLLLKQKRLCDVIFTFQNSTEQIEAHQLYLRERSPVFDVMFQTPEASATGGTNREVEILDSTPARFWEFLEFIYADQFKARIAGALDLLHLALKYKVEPLISKCEALLKTEVQVGEALEVFETAYRYGKQDIMEKAGDLLAKHAGALWLMLMEAQEFTLNYLFRRDDLTVQECDLFKFLIKWDKSRPDGANDLKGALKNLIYLVRYTRMTPNEFTTTVVPTGVLSADEIVQVYTFFGSEPAARSEVGKNMKFSVAPRKAKMMEDARVWFYSQSTKACSHSGNEPLKECISFVAKIGQNIQPQGWCDLSMNIPSITGILLRWPTRKITNSSSKDESLNFKITINSCFGSFEDGSVERKFAVKLNKCPGGKAMEIPVKPPIELTNGNKYCITFEDLWTHSSAPTSSYYTYWKHESVKFTYWAPCDYSAKAKEATVMNLENWSVALRDVEQNKLTGFGNYPRFQVVEGVAIGLV